MKNTLIIAALLSLSFTVSAKKNNDNIHTKKTISVKDADATLLKSTDVAFFYSTEWYPITERTAYFNLKRENKASLIKTKKDFETKTVKRVGKKYFLACIFAS